MEKALPSWMRMGRWSEFRVTRVDHSESIAMWGVEIVRSGDEGLPWEGRRVGVSVLSRVRSESVSVVYVVPPFRRPKVCGLGVPRWMVGVEITQDDSITLGLGEELKGGGEVWGA